MRDLWEDSLSIVGATKWLTSDAADIRKKATYRLLRCWDAQAPRPLPCSAIRNALVLEFHPLETLDKHDDTEK